MADVKQNILFTVGTVGATAAASKVSRFNKSLIATGTVAVVAAAALNKLRKNGEELQALMENVTTDMGDFNKRTNGLIDTVDGLRGAVKLQNLEIGFTSKQFASLGVAAAKMNQKLGGKAGGATKIFNQLVSSIEKGNERALRQFGIELTQTEDKAAAAVEILEKLDAKFGEITVTAQNVSQEMFSLKNSFDTVFTAVTGEILKEAAEGWALFAAEVFTGSDSLREFESDILSTNNAIVRWKLSLDGIENTLKRFGGRILGNADMVREANKAYQERVDLLKDIANIERETARIVAETGKIRGEAAETGKRADWLEKYNNLVARASDPSVTGESYQRAKDEIVALLKAKPKGLGDVDTSGIAAIVTGKPRKPVRTKTSTQKARKTQAELEADDIARRSPVLQSELIADRIALQKSFANVGTGRRPGGGGAPDAKARGEAMKAAKESAEKARFDAELKALEESNKAKEEEQKRHNAAMESLREQYGVKKENDEYDAFLKSFNRFMEELRLRTEQAQIGVDFAQNMFSIQQNVIAKRENAEIASLNKQMKAKQGDAEALAELEEKKAKAQEKWSKKAFEAQKKRDYAATVMSTFKGAQAAMTTALNSGILFPGNLIAGGVASAGVIAAGIANANRIRTQKYTGGFSGGGASSVSASFPSGGAFGDGQQGQGGDTTINVIVDGDRVVESVFNANDRRDQAGDRSFEVRG